MFWTTGCALVQARQEQGEGGRVHQGADLRHADLEGLDRRQRDGHPGQLPPYKSIYADWDANKPDWMPAVRRAWCAASSTRPRRSPTTSSACSSSSSASPLLGDLPQGRGSDPKAAHAEGRRRCPGRNQDAADGLQRVLQEPRGGRYRLGPADRSLRWWRFQLRCKDERRS